MKIDVKKIIKNISLTILMSGLAISAANAQSRINNNNRTVVTKVKTIKTNKHTPAKKVVVTKKVVVNPKANTKTVITKKRVVSPSKPKFVKLPKKAKYVTHNKVKYAYHNGVYYKPYGNSFVTVSKPLGLLISVVL